VLKERVERLMKGMEELDARVEELEARVTTLEQPKRAAPPRKPARMCARADSAPSPNG